MFTNLVSIAIGDGIARVYGLKNVQGECLFLPPIVTC